MTLFALTLGLAPAQPAAPPPIPDMPAAVAPGVPGALAPVVPAPAHPAYAGVFPAAPAADVGPSPIAAAVAGPAARRAFESDHEFDGFINPVSNPIFAKDPRSNTWARFLFINNNFPGSHAAFGGGNAQAYGMQVNVAVTERLAIIADKDGYATLNPRLGAASHGWLNLAAGLKYTLIRDVENQFLFAAGLMYEIPSGEAAVFQNNGGGFITPFISYGKEFCDHWHFIGNHGYSFALDQGAGSSFFYHSFHLDREIGGWFYPLIEANWFHYTGGGTLLPRAVGDGDGLLNLGTQGMSGRSLFSTAVGAKVKFSEHLYLGGAYEVALSDYKGILNNRIIADLVVRY